MYSFWGFYTKEASEPWNFGGSLVELGFKQKPHMCYAPVSFSLRDISYVKQDSATSRLCNGKFPFTHASFVLTLRLGKITLKYYKILQYVLKHQRKQSWFPIDQNDMGITVIKSHIWYTQREGHNLEAKTTPSGMWPSRGKVSRWRLLLPVGLSFSWIPSTRASPFRFWHPPYKLSPFRLLTHCHWGLHYSYAFVPIVMFHLPVE